MRDPENKAVKAVEEYMRKAGNYSAVVCDYPDSELFFYALMARGIVGISPAFADELLGIARDVLM